MMLEIIDLLYDRQGSDPVYREHITRLKMAVDGHQRSVPIRMRPRAVRSGPDQDQGATRTTAPGGRREAPFGPRVSWPYGFPPLDSESREVLESAYGTGPAYSPPAVNDYGYGDPGYADPSYEGPRTPYGPASDGPAFGGQPGGPPKAAAPRRSGGAGYRLPGADQPGYHVPANLDSALSGHAVPGYQPQGFVPLSSGQEIWPVTGAREALPDAGRKPIAQPIVPSAADAWGARGSGRSPQAGSPAYPEQWYDNPRLDDRVLGDVRHDQPRPGGSRLSGPPAGSRPTDPRLEGMNYGELRYDDPAPMDPAAPGQPGYDEPLYDESWYEELRRSTRRTHRASARSTRAGPIAGWSPRRPTTASSQVSRRRRTGRPGTASPAAIGAAPSRRRPRTLR